MIDIHVHLPTDEAAPPRKCVRLRQEAMRDPPVAACAGVLPEYRQQ